VIRSFFRRVKGALGLSTVWAIVSAAVGAVDQAVRLLLGPYPFNLEWVWSSAVSLLPAGFLAGLVYSYLVARVEEDADGLTPVRSGLWGAFAGAVAYWGGWALNGIWAPFILFGSHLDETAVFAAVGFAIGAMIAHLAREAEADEGGATDGGPDVLAEAPPSWTPATPAAEPATFHRRP
jgi:hypothetical protein